MNVTAQNRTCCQMNVERAKRSERFGISSKLKLNPHFNPGHCKAAEVRFVDN